MSFENTCSSIWNLQLTRQRRLEVMRDAFDDFDNFISDKKFASSLGWTRINQWLPNDFGTREEIKESLCSAIMREFT